MLSLRVAIENTASFSRMGLSSALRASGWPMLAGASTLVRKRKPRTVALLKVLPTPATEQNCAVLWRPVAGRWIPCTWSWTTWQCVTASPHCLIRYASSQMVKSSLCHLTTQCGEQSLSFYLTCHSTTSGVCGCLATCWKLVRKPDSKNS